MLYITDILKREKKKLGQTRLVVKKISSWRVLSLLFVFGTLPLLDDTRATFTPSFIWLGRANSTRKVSTIIHKCLTNKIWGNKILPSVEFALRIYNASYLRPIYFKNGTWFDWGMAKKKYDSLLEQSFE